MAFHLSSKSNGLISKRASCAAAPRISAVRRSVLARGAVIDVNDSTFKAEVLESTVPVLVDFWAPWCGPCRMIAPIVDELAAEFGDKIKCTKLNTDESPQVATEYGIRSIPTVMIFKNGQKQETIIGAVPKSTLTQTLNKFL